MDLRRVVANKPQWLLMRLRQIARNAGMPSGDPKYPTLADAEAELERNPNHPLLAEAEVYLDLFDRL